MRGIELAHQKYGSRKKWAELIAPAIALAAKGFPVSYALAESLKSAAQSCRSSRIQAHLPARRRLIYEVGETLVQPELAATLERIAHNGAKDFYEGETAQSLRQRWHATAA